MTDTWNKKTLEAYIANGHEETLTLEYKGAAALEKTDAKRTEITKDVSAMANSAGGAIIYGIAEGRGDRRHLPDRLDPVCRQDFSREWLEQVINSIRPRIEGLLIWAVELDSPSDVAYVVEIPQGTTAHQATDYRYYRRYNFQSVPMYDHEIRDVMNRSKVPDLEVELGFQDRQILADGAVHSYRLSVVVKNCGAVAANHWKLQFTFPNLGPVYRDKPNPQFQPRGRREISSTPMSHNVVYRSQYVLFPDDWEILTEHIDCRYWVNDQIWSHEADLEVVWSLYADNMPRKTGTVSFVQLQEF
jgi:hypothetical protein